MIKAVHAHLDVNEEKDVRKAFLQVGFNLYNNHQIIIERLI